MILQALTQYYQRKQADPDPAKRLPDFGLEQKEIPFVLEITHEGKLVQLHDTRRTSGKKKVGQYYRVPMGIKKTSGNTANLLWDTAEYVLGLPDPKKLQQAKISGGEKKYRGTLKKKHASFVSRITALSDKAKRDRGIEAIYKFLANDPLEQLAQQPAMQDLEATGGIVSFQLHDDIELICQRPDVIQAALNGNADDDSPRAMCLVTGDFAPVERLHTAIKGVRGAQTSGANIVSFNARAFESYGKTKRQGENAPVSKAAAFAYTTALNHLLGKDSRQHTQVGDASTVFWADQSNDWETEIAAILGEPARDDPDANTRAVRALYEAVSTGKVAIGTLQNKFHVLGLSPNAARISIRFYHSLTLEALATNILAHFNDLKISRGSNDPEHPSLSLLLKEIAVQNKADNIPPLLAGGILEAILAGPSHPYPALWINAAINRCRAEQRVNYLRAAAIKACLNRQIRRTSSSEKEFQAMLDIENQNAAYRLGRLFAALEKIQEESNPRINATIRDRYYGAASSTPVAVFTSLLRLKNAHIKKVPTDRSVYFEKLIGEILNPLADFPKHLPLPDQGRFALGYYQQRQAFFTKSTEQKFTTRENQS